MIFLSLKSVTGTGKLEFNTYIWENLHLAALEIFVSISGRLEIFMDEFQNQDMNQNPYYSNSGAYYQNEYNQYGQQPIIEKKSKAFSVMSMVFGIICVVCCVCVGFSLILALLALMFGILSVVGKKGGKGMAISGIILGAVGLIIQIIILVRMWVLIPYFGDIYSDIQYFVENDNEIIEEFEESGELPDRFDKYEEGELGEFFDETYGGFDVFFDDFIDGYLEGRNTYN